MYDLMNAKVMDDLVEILGRDDCPKCNGLGKRQHEAFAIAMELCDCAKDRLGRLVAFVDIGVGEDGYLK